MKACICISLSDRKNKVYIGKPRRDDMNSNSATKCKNCLDRSILMPVWVFGRNLKNWWPSRFCIVFCFIFYIALSLGFKINVGQSVLDLDQNLSARAVMWHMVGLFSSVFLAFYVHEWIKLSEEFASKSDSGSFRADGSTIDNSKTGVFSETNNRGLGGGGGSKRNGLGDTSIKLEPISILHSESD